MGLLVNANNSEKLPRFIVKTHNVLSIVCYIAGLAWFFSLAWNNNNAGIEVNKDKSSSNRHFTLRKSKLSGLWKHNALLPGLVDNEFNTDADARIYLRDLKEEMGTHKSDVPTAWLLLQFRKLGLDAHVHNFTLHYPLGSKTSFEGRNVFAVMKAPRVAGTEALVFAVPFRTPTSVHDGTAPGIALMMALAKFFRRRTYWSKDIIFLVTDHEQLGAHAWLDAYYGTKGANELLDSGKLATRSGKIQAAINLEMHAEYVSRIDVKFEGLTGQLPNLDLFNLVVRLCGREGIKVTIKDRENHLQPHQWDGWKYQLHTMLAMMKTHATGVPSGNHGLFLRYNIEAVTLKGIAGTRSRGVFMLKVGRVLEGVFRSLNNLLESLHQSFFFYLLPATDRYVSIGLYMPPFSLILLPVLLGAIKIRILMVKSCSVLDTGKDSKDHGDSSVPTDCHSLALTLPNLIISHIIGIGVAFAPPYFDAIGIRWGISSGESILIGTIIVFLTALTFPMLMSRRQLPSWESLKCVALLETALLFATISLVNFSLAFIVTTIAVPILVVISPSRSRILTLLKSILLLMCSPIGLGFFALFFDTLITHPDLSVDGVLVQTYAASKRAILFAVTDYYIYSNWLFPVTCIFYYSIWIQFWHILYR